MRKKPAPAADVTDAPDEEARIEYVDLDVLARAKRNPKNHDLPTIRASILRHGFVAPLVENAKTGRLVAGHGRLEAVLAIRAETPDTAPRRVKVAGGKWFLPVVRGVSFPNEQRAEEYLLADNRLVELGGWDDASLIPMLQEISARGEAAINAIGWSAVEIQKAVANMARAVAAANTVITDEDEKMLQDAWRALLIRWGQFVDEPRDYISTSHTKESLACGFLNARLFGKKIPGVATLAYTRHRVLVSGDKGPLRELFGGSDVSVRGVRFTSTENPSLDQVLGSTMPVGGCRLPGDFPSYLAHSLIDEFCPPRGRVLDPCHGWGGRMLGFLLSKASHYTGFDTDPRTHAGVAEMFTDLSKLAGAKKTSDTHCQPFETSDLKPKTYDMAITSPPYGDVEKYQGEGSASRLSDFGDFTEKFYAPMIRKVHAALKPGAVFILQIGSQSNPMEDTARRICSEVGFSVQEVRSAGMQILPESTENGEIVMVLRKG